MKIWLIQRGEMRNGKEGKSFPRKGIDNLIKFDYMGSSEFEFGALNKALKEMRAKAQEVSISESGLDRNGERLFIIAVPQDVKEVRAFLHDNARNPYGHQLKELTHLDSALGVARHPIKTDINVWWDMENGWMAVFGKANAKSILSVLQKFINPEKTK